MRKRCCYYIPEAQTPDPEQGYRVAVVTEGDGGYCWTGDDDWKKNPAAKRPWFWGKTLQEAKNFAATMNLQSWKLSDKDVFDIVSSSIGAEIKERGRRQRGPR